MRILVSLRPTNKRGTKGECTTFRKQLSTWGYVLVQPELFMQTVPTRKAARHALEQLEAASPTTGTVCALVLTERQFSGIRYLVGEPAYQEQAVGAGASVTL